LDKKMPKFLFWHDPHDDRARAFYQILVLYKWIFFALVSFSLKKMT